MSAIDRPEVVFEAIEHEYRLNGEKLAGVSSVAKIGGADDAWGIASAWGFRVGYEGALEALPEMIGSEAAVMLPEHQDQLREELKRRNLTPWAKRDAAADRAQEEQEPHAYPSTLNRAAMSWVV